MHEFYLSFVILDISMVFSWHLTFYWSPIWRRPWGQSWWWGWWWCRSAPCGRSSTGRWSSVGAGSIVGKLAEKKGAEINSGVENSLITNFLYFCYISQLCQLAKEDADYERHHDQNVARTPNIVDGNIQAGWRRRVFKEIESFHKLPIAVFLPSGLARTNPENFLLTRIWIE